MRKAASKNSEAQDPVNIRNRSVASRSPDSAPKEAFKIRNSTNKEVVIREKQRLVLGPIKHTIPAHDEKQVSHSYGTYVRNSILIDNKEIGIISDEDLPEKKEILISADQDGNYTITVPESSQQEVPAEHSHPIEIMAEPSVVKK